MARCVHCEAGLDVADGRHWAAAVGGHVDLGPCAAGIRDTRVWKKIRMPEAKKEDGA